MSRHARGHLPAGVYHVTTRSAGPTSVFTDDDERTRFCNLLATTIHRSSWRCWAFCIMSTHYHLLVEVPDDTLQAGMQRLNWGYARWFNAQHRRSGHLFGERYYCVRVETDVHMLILLRYLARNPVAAGLCERPADWRWGSYRGCIGIDEGFPFVDAAPLHAYFGDVAERSTALMRQFVGDD
jgi:putative transposase